MKKRFLTTVFTATLVAIVGVSALNVNAADFSFFITSDVNKGDAGTGDYKEEAYAPFHVMNIEIDDELIDVPEAGKQVEITSEQAELIISHLDDAEYDYVNVSDDGKYTLIDLPLYDSEHNANYKTLTYDMDSVDWYVIKNANDEGYRVVGYANTRVFKEQTYNVVILDENGDEYTTIETHTGRYPVVPAEVLEQAAQEGKTLSWTADEGETTFEIGEDGIIPVIVMGDVTYAPVYTDVPVDEDDNDEPQGPSPVEPGPQNPGSEEQEPQNPGSEEQGPQNPGPAEQEPQNPGPAPEEPAAPAAPQVAPVAPAAPVAPQMAPAAPVAPAAQQAAPVAPAAPQQVAANDDNQAPVVIEDNETPLAANNNEKADEEKTDIADEETPLAPSVAENVLCYLHWLILVLTIAYIAFEAVLYVRRKNEMK